MTAIQEQRLKTRTITPAVLAQFTDKQIESFARISLRQELDPGDKTMAVKRAEFQKHRRETDRLTEDLKPDDEGRYAAISEQERSFVKAPDQSTKRLLFQQHLLATGRINGDVAPDIGHGNTITIRNPATHGELIVTKPR